MPPKLTHSCSSLSTGMISGNSSRPFTKGYSTGTPKWRPKARNWAGERFWSRKKITRCSSQARRMAATVSSESSFARSTPEISAPRAPATGCTLIDVMRSLYGPERRAGRRSSTLRDGEDLRFLEVLRAPQSGGDEPRRLLAIVEHTADGDGELLDVAGVVEDPVPITLEGSSGPQWQRDAMTGVPQAMASTMTRGQASPHRDGRQNAAARAKYRRSVTEEHQRERAASPHSRERADQVAQSLGFDESATGDDERRATSRLGRRLLGQATNLSGTEHVVERGDLRRGNAVVVDQLSPDAVGHGDDSVRGREQPSRARQGERIDARVGKLERDVAFGDHPDPGLQHALGDEDFQVGEEVVTHQDANPVAQGLTGDAERALGDVQARAVHRRTVTGIPSAWKRARTGLGWPDSVARSSATAILTRYPRGSRPYLGQQHTTTRVASLPDARTWSNVARRQEARRGRRGMTKARISRRDVLKAAVTTAGVAAFPRMLRAQTAAITIGVVSPVTGAMAEVGGDCRLGAQMAADAINAAGGIASMGGARLELLLADSQTSSTSPGRR